jgi:hypothetical protein
VHVHERFEKCPGVARRQVPGEDGTNGGLWCSPVAKTSSPASSARTAVATIRLIRSCSVGARPVTGSGAMSPTVKTPNRMAFIATNSSSCAAGPSGHVPMEPARG